METRPPRREREPRNLRAADVRGTFKATRPRWTATYRIPGRGGVRHRSYQVMREAEARTRLARDVPDAYDITLEYDEFPV